MKSFRKLNQLLTAAVFVFFCLVTAHGQVTSGSVRGSVVDPQNAAVQNAKVTITKKSTNTASTTQTSGTGQFEFNNLQLGDDYELTI